jgi:hypothetical protein
MRKILILAAVLISAALARAETIDEQQATLGWQAENAPVIARVMHQSDGSFEGDSISATFEVLETLRGDVAVSAAIVVAHHDGGHGTPWVDGGEHLVFLRRAGDGRYVSVSGTLGIRAIPAKGVERRFAPIVAEHLSTLDEAGDVREPERLRELLVAWMGDADPGVVWSAATDFHRHGELHDGLSVQQRAAILDAYRSHPTGKMSKRALAHAVADARTPGAADALLDTLELPGARPLRGDVADALAALGAPDAVLLTLARFEGAAAPVREHLLVVLGALGSAGGAPEVRARLSDDDAGVRAQAAHALGLIARAVRAADADARVEGRSELVALIATARTANERKAGTWALAQLDTPEAYAQLRRLAADDPREDVRRYAARYLRQPRVSLILR